MPAAQLKNVTADSIHIDLVFPSAISKDSSGKPPSNITKSTLLLPDAGLGTSGPPQSLRGYFINPQVFAQTPIELTKLWGMNRGRYIGVILSSQPHELYGALVKVERALVDVQYEEQHSSGIVFPARWWLTVNIGRYPNGLRKIEDITDCILEEPFSKYIREYGIPDSTLLGIIIVCENDDANPINLYGWVQSLHQEFLSKYQTSLLVVIKGIGSVANLGFTSSVAQEIARWSNDINVQAVFVPYRFSTREYSIRSKEVEKFSTYVNRSLAKNPIYNKDKLPFMPNFINRSQENNETQIFQPQPSLDIFVHNLIALELDQSFWKEIIDSLYEQNQELLTELAYHSAKSEHRYNIITLFLDEKYSTVLDTLLDAWLIGSDGQNLVSAKDKPNVRLADYLAIAIMRQESKWDRTIILNQLGILEPYLSDEVRSIQDVYEGKTNFSQFVDHASNRMLHLLARANLSIDALAETIKDFDDTDFWYTFLALSPSLADISKILRTLEYHQRAVLGLCTPEEWNIIYQDPPLERKITTCRRGNKLNFHS